MTWRPKTSNRPSSRYNTLPAEPYEKTKARAQAILDLRGAPPYAYDEGGFQGIGISPDEIVVISEFVRYWMPYLVIKEKK